MLCSHTRACPHPFARSCFLLVSFSQRALSSAGSLALLQLTYCSYCTVLSVVGVAGPSINHPSRSSANSPRLLAPGWAYGRTSILRTGSCTEAVCRTNRPMPIRWPQWPCWLGRFERVAWFLRSVMRQAPALSC